MSLLLLFRSITLIKCVNISSTKSVVINVIEIVGVRFWINSVVVIFTVKVLVYFSFIAVVSFVVFLYFCN